MNLSQLETAVANEFGLSVSSEKTVIDSAINRAVQRVLEDTHCYVQRTDFSDFDGTHDDWDMSSSGMLEIVELYLTSVDEVRYALQRVSVPEIIEQRRLGLPTGTPASIYAVTGMNLLMFWPTPSATDVLSVYHVPLPTALASGTDDPSSTSPTNFGGVPEVLHEAIFLYACSTLASYDDDQTSAQGQRYRDWYDKEITRYQKILRKRGGSRNARARVNEKRTRRPFHRNDVYPPQ